MPTSLTSELPPRSSRVAPLQGAKQRKFTTSELYLMAESGLFAEDEKVELIEGGIFVMPPPGEEHVYHVNRLRNLLTALLFSPKKAIVSVQNPVQLSEQSLPLPDIALLKYRDDFYHQHPIKSEDVLFIIEVSHSTIHHDTKCKVPIFVEVGIPEVWILNISENLVHVYREPSNGVYDKQFDLQAGKALAPLAFPSDEVVVFQ